MQQPVHDEEKNNITINNPRLAFRIILSHIWRGKLEKIN